MMKGNDMVILAMRIEIFSNDMVILHYYVLYPVTRIISLRDHDNDHDNNITTDLNDNNHLCYLQNNMITDLNISVIFRIM